MCLTFLVRQRLSMGRDLASPARAEAGTRLGGLEVGEGDVGVGEAGGVYRAGGADQGLDVVVDVPDVDVHAGDHDAAGEPERDELQRVPVAPVEDLVVRARGGQAR